MERAEPGHALNRLADQRGNALLHFAGGFVGEGDGENLAREGFAGGQNMRDTGGQYAGFAGARAAKNQNRAVSGFDGEALFGIQAFEIKSSA